MLVINDAVAISDEEFTWTFARSGGPGGQNVNKVASKAQLAWNFAANSSVPPAVKKRLLEGHPNSLTQDGFFLVTAQETRDQGRNRELCLEKLAEYLRAALVPPKPRYATKPTRSSKKRRIADKKNNSDRKQARKPGSWD